MSNTGQAALAIVGGLVGWVVTAGNPMGFFWGMQLGGLAGSVAFPTNLGTVHGPRLTDLTAQTSTVGAPIAIVYGTCALAGNVIWSSEIEETVKKKKQGGKGAPSQTVKTYTYSVNIAIGICEGPIGEVKRVWAGAKVLYDNRPQAPDESNDAYAARSAASAEFAAQMAVYHGTEGQFADPTIESFEGVGNVSAFRGLAYVVLSDFQLADYGNVIPPFRFEVCAPWAGGEGSCEAMTIGDIIESVCLRSGIASPAVDVSELIDPVVHAVDGYAINRVMSGRDIIVPLNNHTLFDCVESGGQLKWRARAAPAVADLTADDLAAHASGDERRPSIEVQRLQQVEMPQRVRLHYLQLEQNYEEGEQSAARVSVTTALEVDISAPIVMSEQKAAQAAEVLLYDAWASRSRYRLSVSTQWMCLEPGDAITVPVDGWQTRMRIASKTHALPNLIHLECVSDDDGVYSSYALGSPTALDGATPDGADTAGIEQFVVLDIPIARGQGVDYTDAGYFVAVVAENETYFGGAVLYRALDLVTFEEEAFTDIESTLGTLDADLPAGPTTVFDEGNEIIVTLDNGTLESFPESSVLLGYNTAAIGADGRWEIVQFRDAELIVSSPQTNTWRLTGLLRGRRGTEWAVGTGVTGDWFVLLDEALMRARLDVGRLGGEVAHKVVLVGNALANSVDEPFTPHGIGLKPFAPIDLVVDGGGGDLVLTWVRRSRAGTELVSGIDIPLLEASEQYEVDIFDAAASPDELPVRTLAVTSPTATYTAADQSADWVGPPPPLLFRIYQLSAVAGRGYALEGTY